MVLKNKYLTIKRIFLAHYLRRTDSLIKLYKDYIVYLNEEHKRKTENKIKNYKQKEYRKYQKVFYDIGEEQAIFETVYNHEITILKANERKKFRVFREKTRRKIAKLDINTQGEEIEKLKQSIIDREAKIDTIVEAATIRMKEEFREQSEKRLSTNPDEQTLNQLKAEIDGRINAYVAIKNHNCEIDNERSKNRFTKKVERLTRKSQKLLGWLQSTSKKQIELEQQLNENDVRKERKISKLKDEISKHENLLNSVDDNFKLKKKEEKILLSLKDELDGLLKPIKSKDEIIKDNEVLAIDELCMYFGGIKAVHKLSFSVKEKEIFGLIGPNGAGKTTVFNCITQFYKPTAGNISFRNKNGEIVDLTKETVHNVILQGIVRTFQNLEVIKDITVLDNLLIAAHRDYTSNIFQHMLHTPILKVEENVIRQRAIKVLEFMGLLKYKDMYAWGLPYGILKKIEIARTLMCNPQLIILDEPAAGLNDSETVELAQLIRRIRDEYNTTILLVEHDMGLVMDVCDRICAISFGNLLALGTPKEIQNNKAVQEAYLGVSED